MSRTLTSRRDLEDFRQQARNLLHDLREGDPEAVKLFYVLDSEAGKFQARLLDAQYIIPRKHGYKSWRDLKQGLGITDNDSAESSYEQFDFKL